MKPFIIILICINFSCNTVQKTLNTSSQKEAIIYYSKSPCHGKCPVYDLWIYNDGSISYSGISNVPVVKNINRKLDNREIKTLKNILDEDPHQDVIFKKRLDRSITTLRFNNKEYKYYNSSDNDYIKKLDKKIKSIVERIISNVENDT
ncbi:DUF6438 domain-containing protein [Aquimarina algiphila]|uniref:DUF6438 domain-containing protein n=1 Tax=Aquimarina algiphila TaxID=2047982 RepID=UPI00232A8859|nr:DUF6438 domain-containing protein [Aquimarina algiphila]